MGEYSTITCSGGDMTRRKVILVTCDFPLCTEYDDTLPSSVPLYEVFNEPVEWGHNGNADFCPKHMKAMEDITR